MDIKYLLAREQVSLAHARNAACPEARIAHQGLARGYAALRLDLGAPALGAQPLQIDEANENPDRGRAAA